MKMRQLADTGAIGRLEKFFEQRNAALADQLQQVLTNLNPQPIVQSPGTGEETVLEPSVEIPGLPSIAEPQNVGQFDVTIQPSTTPGKETVLVSDDEYELLVDPLVAMDYLQQLGPRPSTEDIWTALNVASSDVEPEAEWEQQFVANRKQNG